MHTSLASDFFGKFNIHFTWIWPRYTVNGFNRWQKKDSTEFSRILKCPTYKHYKCTSCKLPSSTEFIIHQMASYIRLAASYINSILYLTASYNKRRYLHIPQILDHRPNIDWTYHRYEITNLTLTGHATNMRFY